MERATASASAAFLAAATLALAVLTVLAKQPGLGVTALVIGLPSAAVGVAISRQQPHNPIGWLLQATAACLILSSDGGDYADMVYLQGHDLMLGRPALFLYALWTPGLLLLGVVVLLFPDGRLESPVWRWVLGAYVVVVAGYVLALDVVAGRALVARHLRLDATGGLVALDSPSGFFAVVQVVAMAGAVLLWVAAVARQAGSWRRSHGDRRQQVKWLAGGGSVALASGFLAGAGFGPAWLGLAALPVSIGVAILRYRLYDIDRIISRTLSYAVVTGLLVATYAASVLLATRALPAYSSIAVALSTLAVAALFNPLRRRVQSVVDHRFNRDRYDAERTVDAFAQRLQSSLSLDSVRDDMTDVVHRTLGPKRVSVWVPASRHRHEAPAPGRRPGVR